MKIKNITCWFLSVLVLISCSNNKPAKIGDDTITSGTIHISVDESFKPIMDSQVKVFESLFPKAKIITHYKPEAECLKDLMNDSIRMVIVTRALKATEEKILKDTLNFNAVQGKMAYDAITVLVNNKAKDSIFDMADIRSMIKGTSYYKYKVVMDGLSATSTVRYAAKKNIPFAVMIGSREIQDQTCIIKNLIKGDQRTMSLQQLVDGAMSDEL